MIRTLIKGSAIYGLAPFVPRILMVLLLPILTKYLTSTDYGIIGTITSILFAIQALQDLGLRVLMSNYFYKCRFQYKIIWREIYGFLSLWMIVFAFLQALILYIFMPAEAENNKWLIILLSIFSNVFWGPTSLIGQSYYQLNIMPLPVAIRLVLSGVITILANYFCVVILGWGYMGAYVGTFAGTFIMNLSYWPVVRFKLNLSPIYNYKWRTIIRLLKIGIPTIPHYYSGYLMNSSNVVAMNYYGKPKSEIGTLTMAQSFSGMFESLINAVNQVFSPLEYEYIRDKKSDEMKKLLYTYVLITFSLTFMFSLWAKEIYNILISNEEIAATYKYAIILVMALNYRPFYAYSVNYFFFFEHTLKMLLITFVAGLISFLLYFSLMPCLGIYAALSGFYIGCLYLGYSGFLYKFYKEVSVYKIKWFLFFFCQLLLTLITYICVDLMIIYKLLITVSFLSVCICFFIKIKRNEK